jgi:hypothetical protein
VGTLIFLLQYVWVSLDDHVWVCLIDKDSEARKVEFSALRVQTKGFWFNSGFYIPIYLSYTCLVYLAGKICTKEISVMSRRQKNSSPFKEKT